MRTAAESGRRPAFSKRILYLLLLHLAFVGVVVKAEAKSEILSPELGGEGREGIRCWDSAPRCAVEGIIPASHDQLHSCHLSVLGDGELNCQLPLFHLGGRGN